MKRIKQLDALRTLAVFLVLSFHFSYLTKTMPIWLNIGWSGVDLFFVLSGFLISGILFREYKLTGKIRVWRFLGKRSAKIYPAYYILIFVSIAISLHQTVPYKWSAIWPSLVFIQNYKFADGVVWYHLWSMAVEEHFYLLMAGTFWFAVKRNKPFNQIPKVTGIIMVFCLACRCVTASYIWYSHVRFDGLAFGVLISYLFEFKPGIVDAIVRDRGRWLLGATILLLSPQFILSISNPLMYTVGLTSNYLGYGGLLIYGIKCVSSENRLCGYFGRAGVYSYTIYLVHAPVLVTINMFVSHYNSVERIGIAFCSYISISIVVGILFAKLLALPASLWKRKTQTDSIPNDVPVLTLAA
jgi:peptidoglycan/LPS O-acetylase OafA/YrhL